MTMEAPGIRPFTYPQDHNAVSAILHQAELYDSTRHSMPAVNDMLKRQLGSILVADVDGEVRGCVFAGAGQFGLVHGLAIQPGFQRRGYGTLLLQAAEDDLSRRGYTRAEALVDPENADSRALLERRGYRLSYSCNGFEKELEGRSWEHPATKEVKPSDSVYRAFHAVQQSMDDHVPINCHPLNDYLRSKELPEVFHNIQVPVLVGGYLQQSRLIPASGWQHEAIGKESACYRWIDIAGSEKAEEVFLFRLQYRNKQFRLNDKWPYQHHGVYFGYDVAASQLSAFLINADGLRVFRAGLWELQQSSGVSLGERGRTISH